MQYSPVLAEIRLGCGLSPVIAPPESVDDILRGIAGPDDMALAYPIAGFDYIFSLLRESKELGRLRKDTASQAEKADIRAKLKEMRKSTQNEARAWAAQALSRRVHSQTGFRERLVDFWADHFTALGKVGLFRDGGMAPFVEDAIRPNISGRFEDLLIAAVTHPLMLHYLDQGQSVGPNSKTARRSNGKRGLNENLAREVMELHTLGVDGPYGQADVRQLAELFTGLTYNRRAGFVFNRNSVEPGAETVLGNSYSGAEASLDDVRSVLTDLARHPSTARHLSQKIAVHFTADTPDPDLVEALAETYLGSQGDLGQVYATLLRHPACWQDDLRNAKTPYDFVASSFRALAVDPGQMHAEDRRALRRFVLRPLEAMGQKWQAPTGPDGWSEADQNWITPQGLATRVRWAMTVPERLVDPLPDPRHFVDTALGDLAPEPVRFAAASAESRSEAIGLVLSSPAFQRR